MDEKELSRLEHQLETICNRIAGIEQRLKQLRKSESGLVKPRIPHFSHSATFKPSPFAFNVNKPPQVKTAIPKQSSGICLVPSSQCILLPYSSDSDDIDEYFSSDGNGNGSKIVSIDEVMQNLPKNWENMIHEHNKEVENVKFDKIRKVTFEDIRNYFGELT